MKSHLFTDTQDFDRQWTCPPDKICVCLRLDRQFYQNLCQSASNAGLTTGQYMEKAVKAWEALALGITAVPPGPIPQTGSHAGPES